MRKLAFRDGRLVGDGKYPYIIAELNSSHNGKIDVAKQMIDAARDCGCDCVKFQSWSTDSLYSEEYYANNPVSKRIVAKFSLNSEQLFELNRYCDKVGIGFASTPYSREEVDFLADRSDTPFIKVASMEINNLPYLKYIGEKNLPIILSTGMSTLDEIKDAVKAIESTGNRKISILHCVAVYPAPANIINLNNIGMLKREFPEYVIGYSDHTVGYEIAAAAVSAGASIIEKHFTLDNSKIGMDNDMATEPKEMKKLIEACHNVFDAMGSENRVLSQYEKESSLKMRRSLIAKRDIQAGEVLSENDIDAKRPGDGLSPNELEHLIGRPVKVDIPAGYLIRREYISL